MRSSTSLAARHGYDPIKSIFPQLKDALGLAEQPELFLEVKCVLEKLCTKYMDVKCIPSQQRDSLIIIQQNLATCFPNLLKEDLVKDHERRMFFINKAIAACHYGKRNILATQAKKTDSDSVSVIKRRTRTSQKEPLVRGTPSTRSPSIPLRTIVRRLRSGNNKVTESATTNSSSKEQIEALPPTSAQSTKRLEEKKPSTEALSSNLYSSTSSKFSQTLIPISSMHPTPTGPAAIRHFLETCKPSMSHHYRRFIDAGCINEQHLFAMSIWGSESRFQTLIELLGPDVTKMDIMFIEYHFHGYFGHTHLAEE